MELVEPIRDKKTINKMKNYLKTQNTRDYTLFVLGINSGLRISDLLSLTVKDVITNEGKLKDRISLTEQKTGKIKDFPLSKSALEALKEHLDSLKDCCPSSYLFPSRQGNSHLSRVQAWRIINQAAKVAGLATTEVNIGTHTMRKTFGYHAYKLGMDISVIQKLLNHSSPAVTLAYIGITRDDLDRVYLSINL